MASNNYHYNLMNSQFYSFSSKSIQSKKSTSQWGSSCIGFIGLTGELNQAIVIRTFISRNGELWFQAGSGIVAKSNDNYELEESDNKLGALVKAIHIAENLQLVLYYCITIYINFYE